MAHANPQDKKDYARRYYLANRSHLLERDAERRATEGNRASKAPSPAYKAAQLARRRAYVATLKALPCTDCGGRFPPECMDFDHVVGEKVQDISKMLLWRTDRLHDELAKCELVCANCHRIRTARRQREWREGEGLTVMGDKK
jgi:hypothetical protein